MGKINIDFYETVDGKRPVEDFIKSLDKKRFHQENTKNATSRNYAGEKV